MVCAEQSVHTNQTPNTEFVQTQSQSVRAKPYWAKGKHPRSKAKVPKCILSVKGSVYI